MEEEGVAWDRKWAEVEREKEIGNRKRINNIVPCIPS